MNLLGALVLVVYLHGTYAYTLDTTAEEITREAVAAWRQLSSTEASPTLDPLAEPQAAAAVLAGMSDITGTQYGLLIAKATTDAESYSAAREELTLPNNWDEGTTYAMLATTDEGAASRMEFNVAPESVPEIGKLIGIENGACSATCHNTMEGEGDYWAVKWSQDRSTQAHGVFPIVDEGGAPIGVIYAVDDVSDQANAANGQMKSTLFVIAITLLFSTLLIGGLVDRLIFKRLARTVASIEEMSVRVAGGEFDAQFVPDGSHDEIGEFEAFFAQFMDLVSSTLKSLMKNR